MSKISKMLTEIAGDPHYCNNTCTNVGHVTKETNRISTEHFAQLQKSECKKHGEEVVDHPQHYNHGKYECIDVIDDLKLNFNFRVSTQVHMEMWTQR